MLDRTGEVLDGRYELTRLIGEGGMGQVYEGRHLVTGRRVAVKFLLEELSQNAEAMGRFYREARAATAIGSDHICQVLDMRPPEQGPPYLVMEYLDGETLADKLAREAVLGIPAAIEVMLQVCDALQAAHDAGIVHRDIKPENVFLVLREDRPVQVKLLDFGISKFQKKADEALSLTRTGTVLGTPYYMSPEQARGDRDIGPLSDLYSVGVILYEALTGEVPYDAEAFSALVVKIVSATPDHPSALRSDLPKELGDIVLRAFARDETYRYQSAAELAKALRDFAAWFEISIVTDVPEPFSAVGPAPAAHPGLQATVQQFGVSRQTGTPMTWEQEPERRSGLGLGLALGAVLLALLVGGGVAAYFLVPGLRTETTVPVVVVRPADPAPTPGPPPAVGPAAPTPGEAADAAAASPAEGEAGPAKVMVRLSAAPEEATLYLDGERVEGNPAEVELEEGSSHTVVARASGYRSAEQEFVANAETEAVELELLRRTGKRPPTRPHGPTKRPPPTGSGGSVPGVVDPWAS